MSDKTVYILKNAESQQCTLWEADCEHDHSKKKQKVNQRSADRVKELIRLGIKSNTAIIDDLKLNMLPQLSKRQISNLKTRFKSNINYVNYN